LDYDVEPSAFFAVAKNERVLLLEVMVEVLAADYVGRDAIFFYYVLEYFTVFGQVN
jgi:hypothetical protein